MPGNSQDSNAVGHHNMLALPDDSEPSPLEVLNDGIQVSSQAVRCQLNTIRQPRGQVRDERISGLGIALAESPARYQLCICVNCGPGPTVASNAGFSDIRRDLFLLAVAERPNLIDLDALAREVSERDILIARASRAKLDEEFVDGIPGNPSDPRRRAHRVSVNQAPDHRCAFD